MKKVPILFFLLGYTIVAFGQDPGAYVPVQFDFLTKLVGVLMTIGGLYLGYSNMRTATKIAELKSELTETVSKLKGEFHEALTKEIKTMEAKIEISNKELAAQMVTKRDLDYFNKNIELQYDIIKEQLKNAAETYKKDNG